ncbi:tyrosine-type recombinase/integrase [Foetidibacter luteolus]|uniref:tyrosine-type recombinase/integrase n=1 Tax=Foetidibacter luteolus TaxID=2608880 RepID=UPI00129C0F95|nr:tyrosine-type recombinase/integrase [Foetidibacter luteolus]
MTLSLYLRTHYAHSTIKSYQREIAIYISKVQRPENAQYEDVLQYVGLQRSRYGNGRNLCRILSSLKVYYSYLCDAGLRTDNPAKAIKLKDKQSNDIQLQDLFTEVQLEKMMSCKQRHYDTGWRNKVLISLLIYQAMLPGEAGTLTLTDINLEERFVAVKGMGKTTSRILSLKPGQITLFAHYLDTVRPRLINKETINNSFLVSNRGQTFPAEAITSYITKRFKTSYPGRCVSPKIIRQSVIANLFNQGYDVSIVQAFAGHHKPETTMRYKQSNIKLLKSAVEVYHPFHQS